MSEAECLADIFRSQPFNFSMLKRIVFYLCFFAFITRGFGQTPAVVRGNVTDEKTREAVGFARIHIPEADSWTYSDESGNFSITAINAAFFTLEVRCLGFEDYTKIIRSSSLKDSTLDIELIPVSYDMKEVTVLAKYNEGITASSTVGSAAIELVQPASLADVMQLLPGNISTNPELKSAQKISIREIGDDNNSAMGTSILIDGAPVSNNANLQTFSTSSSDNNFITTVGSGIDLRQISTDNIESVEFIAGIPSVTLGDLTSGAVLIRTKAGYTPLEAKLKTDEKIKQFSLGKGFRLNSDQSALNLNFDYLQSFDDIRSKYNGFNRITAEIGYSKIFGPLQLPLTFNAKLNGYSSIDDKKKDPDAMVAGETTRSKDQGLRLNIYGKWLPKLNLLTNLEYSFSVSYTHQLSSEAKYRSLDGPQLISTALTDGEHPGLYLPSEQFTSYVIDGKPLSIFAQLTATKVFNFGEGFFDKILCGFDYHRDENLGKGSVYNLANPPFISQYSSRPKKYSDIPALRNYSVYLEDKLSLQLLETVLDVRAGLRINNFQANGLFKSALGFYAEPRLNAEYNFLSKKNNRIFDKMAVRIGIGKTYKTPPLLYLYPNKAYFDLISLNYYTGNPELNTAIVDTRIFDTTNSGLKPAENLKKEAGLIFRIKNVKATITAFAEKLTNGFGFTSNYVFLKYNRYQTQNIPAGTKPDPGMLEKILTTVPVSYQMPINNQETRKSGVEYSFDLGKIKSIYTSFTIDGAWFRTKRILHTIPYQFKPAGSNDNPYQYIGVYPAGDSNISERLNTNCRMITHIPKLRLILSTTVQVIWYDLFFIPQYDEVPMYLIYADGSTQPFTAEMRSNPEYIRFVINKDQNYYLKELMPPLPQVNFRLSKEINENLKLSFYANNFTNYRPVYEYRRSGSFIRRNPFVYFGAEIKFLF